MLAEGLRAGLRHGAEQGLFFLAGEAYIFAILEIFLGA